MSHTGVKESKTCGDLRSLCRAACWGVLVEVLLKVQQFKKIKIKSK
jgi:hypothetical protein